MKASVSWLHQGSLGGPSGSRVLVIVTIIVAGLRSLCPQAKAEHDVMVVDIIPASLSGETGQDSEPNLAVDPADPTKIAASAFTYEPVDGNMSPIFTSIDGGKTWSCRPNIPISRITSDVTLRFASKSHVLYTTALETKAN